METWSVITNIGFVIIWWKFFCCIVKWIKWNRIQKILVLFHYNKNNCWWLYCKRQSPQIKWYLRWSWICVELLNWFLHLARISLLLKTQPLIFPWYIFLHSFVLYVLYTNSSMLCFYIINKKKETNIKASKALSLLLKSLFHFMALR